MSTRSTTAEAVAALRAGGVIAYPTEAVWGLGCDPRDEAATLRLLTLKIREVDKGLILIAADEAQLTPFIDMAALDQAQRETVRASWPGPHTWIVPASPAAPRWVTGAHVGIAVRVSAHPAVIELCNAFGGALVSTSANRAGEPAAHAIDQLDPDIIEGVDGVLAGETGGLVRPTDIRDARSGAALRL
ncbi:Sua5/YciO/YrdC/YwlC family protein [Thermomonas sp. HDW16]|uniref:Sua5/YciO/YrdC/YwlC family protein n=1 Tax=Thermomonas sp. HDW16 TaxID=2714945 RepID=UPI00140DFAC3|nr:Sua5/YciO/YrdC/YwlC family protein [Thermomonas sp. HDW16]QIL19310.1 tRNA threonylcarbamoyladenosine biosynthesis protein RimN [Thermomonas sp. HDW16]